MNVFDKLSMAGLVPVIKVEKAEQAVPLCKALLDGGLPVAEITFRTAAAQEAIRLVSEALPEVILGAGTVLTCEQVDQAVAAGATYIVSPGFNPKVVAHCIEKGVPVLPGCANPSDIEQALEYGLDTVKFFPAEALGGLKLIKAMSAPYGAIRFVPTGGISEKNLNEYLAFPKVAACGGSWMVPADAIEAGDWARITALTRKAVDLMLGFELRHVGVNSGSDEKAVQEAKQFAALLGWDVVDGPSSTYAGTALEMMKNPRFGTHGHLAIGTNNIHRAMWHLERRGYAFNADSAFYRDGKLSVIYLKDEIGGFAVHLQQK